MFLKQIGQLFPIVKLINVHNYIKPLNDKLNLIKPKRQHNQVVRWQQANNFYLIFFFKY